MEDEAQYREFQRRTSKVDGQIGKADMLEGMRQLDQAQDAYKACFDIACDSGCPEVSTQIGGYRNRPCSGGRRFQGLEWLDT